MGSVVAVGERVRVAGLALAGVRIRPAEEPEEVRAAWRALAGEDVALLLVTPAAADALEGQLPEGGRPLVVVLPARG